MDKKTWPTAFASTSICQFTFEVNYNWQLYLQLDSNNSVFRLFFCSFGSNIFYFSFFYFVLFLVLTVLRW